MPADVARESQGWPFSVLVSVGVPHLVALNAYEQIIEQENHATMGGVDPGRRLEHLQNIVTMLEVFESSARSGIYGTPNTAYEEVSLECSRVVKSIGSSNIAHDVNRFLVLWRPVICFPELKPSKRSCRLYHAMCLPKRAV